MQMRFKGKKVSAILGILPEKIGKFDDEAVNYTFPLNQTMRLKRIMGFNEHRLSKDTTTVSDMAIKGMDYIFDHEWIDRKEIGALIVVTLCPDHFVPHVSNIIQGKCALDQSVICLDVAQGCCGYIVGLMEAFLLLEHLEDKKVILINGDVLMHKISKQDRNEYPVMGDAAAISIVENDSTENPIYLDLKMDGARGDSIIIPAGAFRMPSSEQTARLNDAGDGNIRSLDQMYMDGTEVFNFAMHEVPTLIYDIHKMAGRGLADTDYFLLHQPNKFMVNKIAEKLKVDKKKIPMDLVEKIGNPSGASIPLVASLDLKNELLKRSYKCCLAGFGSGLAYGAIWMDFGKFDNCEVIETEL